MLQQGVRHRPQSLSTLSIGFPSGGCAAQIKIRVRRFRCGEPDCPRRVFAERLEPSLSSPFSERTGRLEGIVHHLGLALGGRPGQSFARRLVIPVSKDTLLRVVRRRAVRGDQHAQGGRHRRLGLEAGPPLRDDHLRPGTAADRGYPAGSGGGNCRTLACRAPLHHHYRPRPRAGVCAGGHPGPT